MAQKIAACRSVTFKDHFSGRARVYAEYRPGYPDELFEIVAGLQASRERAWDCATGSGQAAEGLARRFALVVASDASSAQIAHARRLERVHYVVATAESAPLATASIGLVVAAQALHWLNAERFFSEARRVLKPTGAVAVWGYGDPHIDDPDLDSLLHDLNRRTLEPYWGPEREVLLGGFRSLPFPFHEVPVRPLELSQRWALRDLCGYLRSWSATARFIAARDYDPVDEFERRVRDRCADSTELLRIRWPLFVRAGRLEPSAGDQQFSVEPT